MANTEWPYGYGFCHCGCGQRTGIAPQTETKRGYVKGEPVRFIVGHYTRTRPAPAIEPRFWTFVDKSGDCWEWRGVATEDGYGRFMIRGKRWLAHRVAYALANGPIPDGFFVCHHCDNPRCVRPSHLFLGTNRDNMQDASQKGHLHWNGATPPVHRGERNNLAKLTADTVRQIRAEFAGGDTITAIGARYGVTKQNVSCVVRRKTWRHVP